MKRRLLSIFLSLTMILMLLPNTVITSALAANAPWKGSGTSNSPYQISSKDDLMAIADEVNGGNDLTGVYFEQTRDIDLEEEEWPTIGITINNTAHQFNGVYNGGDFDILGLYVNRNDDDAGLFGYVGPDGVIRNVHVEDGDVIGAYWVGGIAGRNNGIVEYCSFSGYVYGSQQYIGGIVGDNHGGTVRYCYNLGDVEFDNIGGGVIGRNSGGTVENCYNRGYVCSRNLVRGYAGGVIGENTGNSTVDNCYSDGWVDGNSACGAIVGANGDGSSVENCFYPEDFEDAGLSGVGSSNGTIENVTPKSEEQFDSGEVAWELSQGTNGSGWGQGIDDPEEHHPHFMTEPKRPNESPVHRVTFSANDPNVFPDLCKVFYIDPGDFPYEMIPTLYGNAKWYVNDVEFDGKNINGDVDVYAGERVPFAGEDGVIVCPLTYSLEPQVVSLDQFMRYDTLGPSAAGRFTYSIIGGNEELKAAVALDGKSLIIPARANVKEGGYTLTVSAREDAPYIAPLSMGNFSFNDVTLTVNILIEKATPSVTVKPDAMAVNYGTTLSGSTLSGGGAVHPGTDVPVNGLFVWSDGNIVPTVNAAAITGYYVTFIPYDSLNYNTASAMATLTVNKVAPTILTLPSPVNSTYNGMAENLITEGSADGGTMKYWISDDPNAVPPEDNSAFSSTIPSRANAGTYKIWYKVIGDENHFDTIPNSMDASIYPYPLNISEQHITYNGGNTFTVALNGVTVVGEDSPRTVIAYITAGSKDAGDYVYTASAAPNAGEYTAVLSSSNYIVGGNNGKLIIEPLPAIMRWEGQLTFQHDNLPHTVTASVYNAIEGDSFALTYQNNSETAKGFYTAKVTGLGNPNYTLDTEKGAQNITQPWLIFEYSENIDLYIDPRGSEDDPITYGDRITLTAEITAMDNSNLTSDTVDFYVNRELVGSVPVTYQPGSRNGKAILVIENATSRSYFSIGANVVRADYMVNGRQEGIDAVTVFVEPKPISATFIGNTDKIYDGNNIAAWLELIPTDVEDYDDVKASADNFTYNSPDAAKATTITANNVILSGANSGNYIVTGKVTTAGRIIPKGIKLEWRGSTGLVYSGSPANVNATATEYLPGDECLVEVTNGNAVNAGSYVARASSLSNSNYKLPDDSTTIQPYEIAKADLYIPEQKLPYNGTTKFKPMIDGVTLSDGSTDKVQVDLTASGTDVGEYDHTTEEQLTDKTYTANIDNANYVIAGGAMLIIVKADPTYKAPVPKKLIYNGREQTLASEGTANGGKMLYSLSENGPYTDAVPNGIKIGEYTVWFKIIGDANHNDIAPQSVKTTISSYEPNNGDTPGSSPNTGIELNTVLYFLIVCVCITAVVLKLRKAR